MIECKNISLSYEDLNIFEGFSFSISKGESVCFSGESGKGKSTLLKLLLGFELPDNGQIFIDNELLNEKTIHEIREKITWIPQNINLPVRNGEELIEMLHITNSENKISNLLSSVNLESSILKKDFLDISGGQKQRIIIAICLSINKDLIFLDEPTSSLDENSIQILIKMIQSLKGKTIVSTSHNVTWLNSVDRVIQL